MNTSQRGFIAACEREQLHLSGAIQAYGAMIIANQHGQITHVSEQVGEFYPEISIKSVGHGLPDELWNLFRQFEGQTLWFSDEILGAQGELDVVLNPVGQEQVAIELLPSHPSPNLRSALSVLPKSIMDNEGLKACRQKLVDYIAELTGFERTIYYHFLPSGDGEVLAESCSRSHLGSYLQLRFPANDIPQIARSLYLKNPWRCIFDAKTESVSLVSRDDSVPDLTHAVLRSVSPVHIHYMNNMGVRSSVSWSIAGKDDLLALLSIHDSQAKQLPFSLLDHINELVERYNFLLREYRTQQRMNLHDRLQSQFNYFADRFGNLSDAENLWEELATWLMDEFNADGVVLQTPLQRLRFGAALEDHAVDILVRFMKTQDDLVWVTDNFLEDLPAVELSQVAGVAALRSSNQAEHHAQLFLCRNAELYQVAWGGRPDKPLETDNPDMPISPRRSFEKWIETRHSFSAPWDENTRIKLMKMRLLLNEF
ncbi:GAF domain-containing protein [Pseudidiomarina donghaiensis]|uniref:Phytochrome chromophore attachment site domain-containing protein n=1 Tax=Pseudidiomarina donghaiensis TaxID=519452 RepID=A0A432XIM7_9GAMM|nr:GAF domain-containing protein [Pseudidiomarina donghaiensis]RUO48492.1 hypothetical protein CWE24_06850 [Pseudidiomarina donghaiensis]SFV23849.1 GAF domain-containing protein [Pseudidiomarina donghaiensis]